MIYLAALIRSPGENGQLFKWFFSLCGVKADAPQELAEDEVRRMIIEIADGKSTKTVIGMHTDTLIGDE